MTISSKLLTLADYKAAQYTAIIGKGGTVTQADWGAYAAAIDALPSGDVYIPAQVLNMPFTAGAEPLGGTVWYVRPGGAGDRDGRDWDNAFATRQEAVNAASPGDQVRVWEGTYYLEAVQTPKAGVSEYYSFNDDGSWAKRQPFTHPSKHDAGFTGNNFNNTAYIFMDAQIIDGLWMQNVVTAGGIYCTQKTVLRNCVVTNCTASNGGGMFVNSSSTATNCVVTNCTANSNGGGMFVNSSSTATNCVVTNCTASNGGGMFVNSSSTAPNCVVTNCTASNGNGGGMSLNSSTATNCVVTNCTASNGGGMFVNSSSTAPNCVVTNCTATGGNGGGMYVFQGGLVYNCTVILCSSPTGSGFWVGSGSQRLYNCCSWGCDIYLAQANYAYKIYNCASDSALTGVSGWDTIADVQNFLPLSTLPFKTPGVAPFDGSGAYYTNLAKGEESLAFIDRVVLPSVADAHLPTGSPLIGAGYYEAGVTPDTDADGKARPLTPSIGAYEP